MSIYRDNVRAIGPIRDNVRAQSMVTFKKIELQIKQYSSKIFTELL